MYELRTTLLNAAIYLGAMLAMGLGGVLVRRALSSRIARGGVAVAMLATFVVGLAGLCAEVAARFGHGAPVVLRRNNFVEYRPDRFALAPNAAWTLPPLPGWRRTSIATNEDGLRTRRHRVDAASPSDDKRVLFLGDSWTFGLGLEEAETYPTQVEGLLRAASGDARWVTLNAGVPGYNLHSAVEYFEFIASYYRPTVAVITLNFQDDLRPDINGELRKREYVVLRSLDRFALYRVARRGMAALRYHSEPTGDDGAGLVPTLAAEPVRRAELKATTERLLSTARRLHCRVIFHVIRYEVGTREGRAQDPREKDFFRPFAEAGMRFVATDWDRSDPSLSIPNDGHPTPAGALLLARAVVKPILDDSAP